MSFASDAYTPDRLLAGDADLVTATVTLASGTLLPGAVLGRDSSGDYKLSAAAAGDGTEVPRAILAAPADASGGPVAALVYLAGEFNEDALTFGAGHDPDSVRDPLDLVGIYLKSPVSA